MMKKITISGILIGKRGSENTKTAFIEIVHIQKEYRPEGPAENSILEITRQAEKSTATYIPWVGYFDLDRENKNVSPKWEIIEPGKKYLLDNVEWTPFQQ
ncbi:hypothetical protein ESA94_18190 [Lacibacter luteus]|uniref:Uncharacterized protein n=1 Tax=Lacibacter luteus TaxID=2508719 RepID=A0A4Q1CFX1_9BACT|nr:hypothetical protein [Lacibacter luteus]RXK58562.1 hypothetical protein ESA94_18190 [Lacibacter luteus]